MFLRVLDSFGRLPLRIAPFTASDSPTHSDLGTVSSPLRQSGAIMAVLGYVCTESPDSRLAIVLLPMLTFTAGTAIKAVVAFDALGAALRWQLFDHAAHLGGALFGV